MPAICFATVLLLSLINISFKLTLKNNREKEGEFYDDWYDEIAEEVIEPYLYEKLPTLDYQKHKTELNVELYDRMRNELFVYKEELLTMSPQEILRNACEFVDKEDIVYSLEENNLEVGEVKALLKREHPLQDVYLEYANSESEHMTEIFDAIERSAQQFQREDRHKTAKGKGDER